jgi:hypothetical protein
MSSREDLLILPPYSTERYFILSEIEQNATFAGLENGKLDYKLPEGSKGARGLYILWKMADDASKDIEVLQKSIDSLVGACRELSVEEQEILITFETLLTSRSDWEVTGDKKRIQAAMDWVKSTYQFGGICFGASDHLAGAPALEALCDLVTSVEFQHGKAEDSIVVAESKADFLGHDPLREPEAESNVFQAQLVHVSEGKASNKNWVKALVSRSLYADMDDHHPSRKGKYDYILTWGSFIFVSVVAWYVFVYFKGHVHIQEYLFKGQFLLS